MVEEISVSHDGFRLIEKGGVRKSRFHQTCSVKRSPAHKTSVTLVWKNAELEDPIRSFQHMLGIIVTTHIETKSSESKSRAKYLTGVDC